MLLMACYGRTDGRTDGRRTDGRTDGGRTDGQIVGSIDRSFRFMFAIEY